MFRIRGKTEKGDSVTGVSSADSFADAAKEAEESAESAGDALVQLSIKPLDEGAGIKIAKPRKRGEGGEGGGRKKGKAK